MGRWCGCSPAFNLFTPEFSFGEEICVGEGVAMDNLIFMYATVLVVFFHVDIVAWNRDEYLAIWETKGDFGEVSLCIG